MWKVFLLATLLMFSAGTAFAVSAVEKDELIMGTAVPRPPFAFINPEGQVIGFNIDFAEMISQNTGKKVTVVPMEFQTLIPSLLTGKIDFILANMSRTAERAKKVAFTRAYYVTPPDALIVRQDQGLADWAALEGKVVGCAEGTTHHRYLDEKKGEYRFADMKPFPSVGDAVKDLEVGRVDAVFMDGNTARRILRDPEKKLKVAFRHRAVVADEICMAARPDDKELVDFLNAAILDLEEQEKLYELRVNYDLE